MTVDENQPQPEPVDAAPEEKIREPVPPVATNSETQAKSEEPAEEAAEDGTHGGEDATPAITSPSGRRIKIGSQRDPAAAEESVKPRPQPLSDGSDSIADDDPQGDAPTDPATADSARATTAEAPPSPAPAKPKFPPPRLDQIPGTELQHEIEAAIGDVAIDELMLGTATAATEDLEEGTRVQATVLLVRHDDVFVDLGGRNQGVLPSKQFEQPPEPGATLEAIVSSFNSEEGIYELLLPDAAVDVSGWEQLTEGMVVEAVVTGHNKGGLECEVNKLRGFMPVSQVSLYRVDNMEEFVGQRFSCVVTEVKPERRNLVLSRRAFLERERAEAKKKLLEELEVGQIREGVVRRLQPFGAFVDLGGVDGLVHVSQLSWDRVNHPSEVLEEGQTIKVKISKIDTETGKIGLAYRDTWENPWNNADQRYKAKSTVEGTVTRLMDFGAFVRLEPGIEGLIHVSELDHRRVWRASDVLSEGQQVEVMILSVDAAQQRISLSLKALQAAPERETKKKEDQLPADDQQADSPPPRPKHQNLRGGVDRPSDGDKFGLKW